MTAYIIKLVLCSGMLLLAYMLLLEKEKMHRFNRFYLLISLVFPLLVPFINVEGQKEVIPFSDPVYIAANDGLAPVTVGPPAFSEHPGAVVHPLVLIYFSITSFLLFRFIKNLVALLKKARTGKKIFYEGM